MGKLTLAWVLFAGLATFGGTQDISSRQIFHGSSVMIYPDYANGEPSNATFVSANFYCYFTLEGYFSFGWSGHRSIRTHHIMTLYRWLPAVPGAGNSHCAPDSRVRLLLKCVAPGILLRGRIVDLRLVRVHHNEF